MLNFAGEKWRARWRRRVARARKLSLWSCLLHQVGRSRFATVSSVSPFLRFFFFCTVSLWPVRFVEIPCLNYRNSLVLSCHPSCFGVDVDLFFLAIFGLNHAIPSIRWIRAFVDFASLCRIVSCWMHVLWNSHEMHPEKLSTNEYQVSVRVLIYLRSW